MKLFRQFLYIYMKINQKIELLTYHWAIIIIIDQCNGATNFTTATSLINWSLRITNH